MASVWKCPAEANGANRRPNSKHSIVWSWLTGLQRKLRSEEFRHAYKGLVRQFTYFGDVPAVIVVHN